MNTNRNGSRLLSHPLHPIFTHFPMALLMISLLWDILGLWQGDPFWWSFSFWSITVGLIFAVLAMVTGLIVVDQLGPEALKQILSIMAEARVREWEPRLRGLSMAGRMEALKEIYLEGDTFMDVDNSGDRLALIEHNCPFLNVAKRRPVLCSVTISMLTRLMGYRVVREERFQNGDGRCVFRVLLDQPIDESSYRFSLET
ncbi:MAG: DUF2231 domain-containing protein [Bacilli bacterium]